MYPRDVDDREFGIDPDDERCPVCGAGPLEPCLITCDCETCKKQRDRLGVPQTGDAA